MIEEYLDLSIGDLISLVDITQKDIKNIKEANHEEIFASIKIKEDLIVSFEQKKRLLDNELSKYQNQIQKKILMNFYHLVYQASWMYLKQN